MKNPAPFGDAMWVRALILFLASGCASQSPPKSSSSALDSRPPPVKGTLDELASSVPVAQTQTITPDAPPAKQADTALAPPPPMDQPAPKESGATRISHAALGCEVEASSSNMKFASEGPPSALVDGDLTTRWSSQYKDGQHVILKLPRSVAVDKVRLHWEAASASKYSVAISSDGNRWETIHAYWRTSVKLEPRTDEVPLKGREARMIKVDLETRANPEWGFSLFEIEVVPWSGKP